MAEETENGKKIDDVQIRQELLAKSKALKERVALLKAQMDATAKACEEFLHNDKKNFREKQEPENPDSLA